MKTILTITLNPAIDKSSSVDHTAVKALLQCHGIGGMRPNTVLLGWSLDPKKSAIFYESINTVKEMRRSLIIVATEQEQERIDIPGGTINRWWNSAKNVQLMLPLTFMLKKNREWRDHPIRIIRPVVPKADKPEDGAGIRAQRLFQPVKNLSASDRQR